MGLREKKKQQTREMILNNSILDLTNSVTPSDPISIGLRGGFPGRFTIVGQSILRSTAGNQIIFPERLKVQFTSGARLCLENGTCLIVD